MKKIALCLVVVGFAAIAALAAITLQDAKNARKGTISMELRERVFATYTIEDLVFAGLGLPTQVEADAVKAAIAPMVLAAKQAKVDVDAVSTKGEVNAFAW